MKKTKKKAVDTKPPKKKVTQPAVKKSAKGKPPVAASLRPSRKQGSSEKRQSKPQLEHIDLPELSPAEERKIKEAFKARIKGHSKKEKSKEERERDERISREGLAERKRMEARSKARAQERVAAEKLVRKQEQQHPPQEIRKMKEGQPERDKDNARVRTSKIEKKSKHEKSSDEKKSRHSSEVPDKKESIASKSTDFKPKQSGFERQEERPNRSHSKKETHIPGYDRKKFSRSFGNQDWERENEPSKKLLKYLRTKAGKVLSFHETLSRLGEKAGAKKKKFRKEKWEAQETKRSAEEYLSIFEKEGLIEIQGKNILVHPDQTLEGTISLSKKGDGFAKLTTGTEIFVPSQYTGTAIQGDTVQILPTGMGRKGKLEGEVVSVLRRGRELYRMKITEKSDKFIIGTFLDMDGEGKESFLPRKSLLQDIQDEIKLGDVLVVSLKEENNHERNLYESHFIRFESDTKEDVDLLRMLMKYNFKIQYPDDVELDSLPEEVSEASVSDWGSRVDLRNLKCITIDGEYSKDFDDAISFEEEGKRIRFYVHIADVANYVEPGSPLDVEAYTRATSVYMGSRVVPMLPPELSENLCSLVAGKNRLAFTVEMDADWQGNITHAKFYKSIIKVAERYTYNRAEKEILEGGPENWIGKMMSFANVLRERRLAEGRVDLNLKETKVITDSEHNIIEIATVERLKAHILIEEFMLSANIKVAEFIRKKKRPTLYRVHEPMDVEKLDSLNAFLNLNGINAQLKDTSYESIKNVLGVINGSHAERLFNISLLRSFMQAYYSGEQLGHWGLGFKDYCHFTSPIRRYPDLVCHRVLQSILLEKENLYNDEDIKIMSLHTSHEERKAADAERDYYKLKACRFLEKTGIQEFTATLTGFKSAVAFVDLDTPMVEAIIPALEFTDEGELILENDFTFYSKKYSKLFTLGEQLSVELDRIDFEEIRIYVKLKKFQKKG
ncbi:putative ribonuclease R [Leptospira inadai serovar Lyme str. 10]|uniref:exoribonuclease II n=2 Tax=Leptospira inadai serovar Lyme TaxID=293084 RepID=V6H8C4_9LEPT|nr:putative ribonuclease R [Leptospira inadai serovar Lyme str. 10]PNV75328.1 ribonuclease R [Leptospira inadai serovar Lyme]